MAVSDLSALDHLIEAFVQHERRTRGLRDRTLQGYARIARLLIRNTVGEDPIDVGTLRPPDIDGFVRAMTGRYSPRSMKTIRSAQILGYKGENANRPRNSA